LQSDFGWQSRAVGRFQAVTIDKKSVPLFLQYQSRRS
jgi:hypothetical protein